MVDFRLFFEKLFRSRLTASAVGFLAFIAIAIGLLDIFYSPSELGPFLSFFTHNKGPIIAIIGAIIVIIGAAGDIEIPKKEPIVIGEDIDPVEPDQRDVFLGDGAYLEGADVRDIQEALQNLGYNIAVDGKYGPVTEECVKIFQTKNGLNPDGIVGPKTREKLLG